MHWTQALRARGFTEDEINKGVKRWKKYGEWKVGEGKNLPRWEDVEDVFGKKGLTEWESEKKGRVEMDRADRREERSERSERRKMDGGGDDEKERSGRKIINRRGVDEKETGMFEKKRPLESRKDKSWSDLEDKYAGTPYPGYICKRCGGSGMFVLCFQDIVNFWFDECSLWFTGHHLQVCPTNLDPSWDEPPEPDYECTICGIQGDHYKSLCPRNADPNCLNQKRRRAGIPIMTPEKKSKNLLADWERDIGYRSRDRLDGNLRHSDGIYQGESSRSSGLSRENDTPPTSRRQELFALDERRNRLLAEDQADFIRRGGLNIESTSPAYHRKRARELPENENNFGRLSLHNDSSSPEEGRKRVRFAEPASPPRRKTDGMGMGFAARVKKEEGAFGFSVPASQEGDGEIELELSDDEQLAPNTPRRPSTVRFSDLVNPPRDVDMADYSDASSSDGGDNIPVTTTVTKEKRYTAVVLSLMKRHPEMSVVVNVRRCGTATDLWKTHTHSSRRVETYVET